MASDPKTNNQFRIEKDALGEVRVPTNHLWGAQTERSRQNFTIGVERHRWGRPVVHAFGLLKKCAALANLELGHLPKDKVELIVRAAEEVIHGKLDHEFPLVVFQTGSGTQSNMNANEVIANRAIELAGGVVGSKKPIHPNDDVNHSQSSNDVFPTVMHIATVHQIKQFLLPAVGRLRDTLDDKAKAFSTIVMVGRTHMQDATPLTLGQAISGWAAQISHAIETVERACEGLLPLAIGGTAVGTGLDADPRFGDTVARKLAEETGTPYTSAFDEFAALSADDAMVNMSAALRTLAGALMKMANDIRLYASGPRAGIGELKIPERTRLLDHAGQDQSDPMRSLDHGRGQGVRQRRIGRLRRLAGNFQLNVYRPVALHNVLKSIQLLAEGCRSFDENCARGIEPNEKRIKEHLDNSLMLVTALNPHIGYEKAAEIALKAYRDDISLREAALALGHVTADQFDKWIRPEDMIHPLPIDGEERQATKHERAGKSHKRR